MKTFMGKEERILAGGEGVGGGRGTSVSSWIYKFQNSGLYLNVAIYLYQACLIQNINVENEEF